MASIDHILQRARQRRALQEAADERRLKERLLAEAERAEQIACEVAASVTLRALGAATAHGSKAERVRDDDKANLRPHPNAQGRKPLASPAAEVADKGRKWGGVLPGSFETGRR